MGIQSKITNYEKKVREKEAKERGPKLVLFTDDGGLRKDIKDYASTREEYKRG